MAIGQSDTAPFVNTFEHNITYQQAGTYYYACTGMCLESTGGPAPEYCHCSAFNHKLVVHVSESQVKNSVASPAIRVPAQSPESITSESGGGMLRTAQKVAAIVVVAVHMSG